MGKDTDTGEDDGKAPVEKVAKESGNFITRLFAPIFGGVSGMGKGAFGNTIGNPMGVLKTAGIVALIEKFAPAFFLWFPLKVGDKKVGEIMGEDIVKGGTGALIKDSLLAGAAINATTGAVGGLVGGVASNTGGDGTSMLGKIASITGGAGLLAGAVYLVSQVVKSHDISIAGVGDGASGHVPPTTPAKPVAAVTNQRNS